MKKSCSWSLPDFEPYKPLSILVAWQGSIFGMEKIPQNIFFQWKVKILKEGNNGCK